MNWLEFFSNLIGNLAWPLVVVVSLLLFKKTLRNGITALLDKTSGHLEGWGLSAKWDAIATRAEGVPSPESESPSDTDTGEKNQNSEDRRNEWISVLEDEDGATAIRHAIADLESILLKFLRQTGGHTQARGLRLLSYRAISSTHLRQTTRELLNDTIKMLDLIEYNGLPSTQGRAWDFLQVAGKLKASLEDDLERAPISLRL